MIVVRWAVSMVLAALITLALFYFMQYLIDTGDQFDERITVVKIVDATMPEIINEVIEEIDKPEMIEEVQEDIPDTPDKQISLDAGPSLNIDRAGANINTGLDLGSA
jgi:protein TonB